MLNALYPFCALSIAAALVLSLLPRGPLRRTASMVVGLMALLCWAESFLGLLQRPAALMEPVSILSPTSISLQDLSASEEE